MQYLFPTSFLSSDHRCSNENCYSNKSSSGNAHTPPNSEHRFAHIHLNTPSNTYFLNRTDI